MLGESQRVDDATDALYFDRDLVARLQVLWRVT